MKHAVAYALIHHDGKKTWKIKDLSIFLRQYDECVEALKLAIQEVQEAGGNRSIDLDGQWLSSAVAALAHAEAPHA